jgi:hypothetical protein
LIPSGGVQRGAGSRTRCPDTLRDLCSDSQCQDKTPVLGIVERGGKVRTIVIPSRKKKALQSEVRKHVEAGAIGLLDGFYYSSMSLPQLRKSFAQEPIPDPLTRTFAAFHRTLDVRVSELVNCDPLQSSVFSDSAFVIFRDLNTAICFAQDFMRDLISFRVPVRMGIGRGTFRGLRLTTDISDEVRRHSSQFLGTGVIRAVKAESCGLKGLRIFIHPESKIIETWPGDLCAGAQDGHQGKLSTPVIHKLNYLWHDPDFTPRADGPQTSDDANDELVNTVTEMMYEAPSGTEAQYQQTLAAMRRMHDACRRRPHASNTANNARSRLPLSRSSQGVCQRAVDCSAVSQLPSRTPNFFTPLTQRIPAARSGLRRPQSAAS